MKRSENSAETLTVQQVAQALGISVLTVHYLLASATVNWGMAYRRKGSKRRSYIIYRQRFEDATGIKIEIGGDDK